MARASGRQRGGNRGLVTGGALLWMALAGGSAGAQTATPPTPAPPAATEPAPASASAATAPDPAQLAAAGPGGAGGPGTAPAAAPAGAAPVALAPTGSPTEPAARVAVTPESEPARAEALPAPPPPPVDPWARPFFVKGDLSNFVVRPMTRRNFIGVGAGISAVPNDADTLLNAFYFTVEPQVDIVSNAYNWRLGLGAPLQFELVDTRGAFETCVTQGRETKNMGGSQTMVAGRTATCLSQQQSRLTQNFGRLRRADWDEASDFARIIRYMVVGGQEQPFYLNVSRLYDQSFGHGTVVRDYNANIDYNTARLGATLDFNKSAVGVQAMANDLVNPDVIGMMAFVRPMRPYSENIFWRSLSVGLSYVHGVNLPRTLFYEPGLFPPSFDQPIPRVDPNLDLIGGRFAHVSMIGGDIEAKLVRTQTSDLKVYFDYQKMLNFGGGATAGSLWRFSYGQPAKRALRARAEVHYFSPDYLPSFFDTYHDIFAHQYLPMAYKATNGLTYYPTKVGYLEANKGGRQRMGGYLEVSHSFLDYLTVGAVARAWTPVGSPKQTGFTGPSFPDLGPTCTDPKMTGELTCPSNIALGRDPGFSSVRLHAELPFRRFLQAFAAYEVFSTTGENGLGMFSFDGDNEIFFSGARMMLLPVFFIQAEARRYFFLQRLTNVNLQTLTVQQDQNYHSKWTFAVNAFVGYEF